MSDRNLTDADLAALAKIINDRDHCAFTEEERVMIKKFVRFLDRTAAKVGTLIILGVLGSLAAMWLIFTGR